MLRIDSLSKAPDAELQLPGSKSISNRALVISALAEGTSTLSRALFAEDTLAMIDCLKSFGIDIKTNQIAETIIVTGTDGRLNAPQDSLWVRQSGTTARFILPMAALTAAPIQIDGDEQIRSRPQADLLEALNKLGVEVTYGGEPSHLPLTLNGSNLKVQDIAISGETSSQYLSALLLVSPCLPEKITFTLEGNAVSVPYIDMTIEMMRAFGAKVEFSEPNTFTVHPTGYKGRNYEIETDASTASYFFAAAAVSQGRVVIHGIGENSIQGDLEFVNILDQMGAKVSIGPNAIEVSGQNQLNGIEISMRELSDTAPTLAAIAPYCSGTVRVNDIGFIKNKESDRVTAVVTELNKLGVIASIEEDGFVIEPGSPTGNVIHSYDDHRIAMAFTVLGLLTEGVIIDDPNCVAKTCPEFFEHIDSLRLEGDKDLAILAIDGPAGSGKSSLAKLLAQELELEYLDTGAMYRSIAAEVIAANINPEAYREVTQIARNADIAFNGQEVFVNDTNVTQTIRNAEVNAIVSYVAANPGVRAILRRAQRSWARQRGGGVLEGRDIGSVVFPKAKLKVYVTATPEERARRRSLESGRAMKEILNEIQERDEIDSSRADSPLSISSNAIVVDTTDKTLAEVAEEVLRSFNV
jgi:3-phosphoshikimate 1-carboxyvinyltransferase